MAASDHRIFRFGKFTFDPHEGLLRNGHEATRLPSKTCEVLLVLVNRPGELVSKGDLLEIVWKDAFVEEGILTVHISQLRKLLGDDPYRPRYLETVPKKGYKFKIQPEIAERGSNGQVGSSNGDTSEQLGAAGRELVNGRWPSRSKAIIGAFLSVVAIAALAYWSYTTIARNAATVADVVRLVGVEKARMAAISPDGKFVAYVNADGDQQSLWVRQLATNASSPVVPAGPFSYLAVSFSSDSNLVHFVRKAPRDPHGNVFNVSVLGGEPVKFWEKVDGPISFSPDGGRFAFVRQLSEKTSPLRVRERETAIVIAETSSGQERTLADSGPFNYFSTRVIGWSPIGDTVVVALADINGVTPESLVDIRVSSGESKVFSPDWNEINDIKWLRDSSALVASGRRSTSGGQIYRVSYPAGQASRLTQDTNDYGQISLSADRSAVLASVTEQRFRLWSGTLTKESKPIELAGSIEHVFQRVSLLPGGRIVFPSSADGMRNIWMMEPDGTQHRQLTSKSGSNLLPSACGDGKYIVFSSNREGGRYNIWRIGADGMGAVRLTAGEEDFGPQCSPDGKWVLYMAGPPRKETIWRVSIDGGEPQHVITKTSSGPAVSSSGDLIAAWYRPDDGGEQERLLGIFAWLGGEPLRSFTPLKGFSHPVKWTRLGDRIIYVATTGGASNLWAQDLAGGEPRQVTNFQDEIITGFDLIGEDEFVVSRGHTTRGVALFTGLVE